MISIVVPVLNEEESIEIFYNQLVKEIKKLDREYEIIFIDDGSIDNSLNILKKLAEKDSSIRIFSFRRNLGKAEALSMGFAKAKGEFIVTLDADLQDQPSEIAKLLEKAHEGWDLVCGWRSNRRDPVLKVLSSKIFNTLASSFWGLHLHDYNCGLKVYRKTAAKGLNIYGGFHRFIPLLVFRNGFRVCEVAVVHQKRKFGKSKYGFSKLWRDMPDMFTMLFLSRYSDRPLHFFGMVGGIFFILGIGILGYLSILHFLGEAIGRRPLLFLGMLLVLAGFQVFFTGFLADMIRNMTGRSTLESQEELIIKYKKE